MKLRLLLKYCSLLWNFKGAYFTGIFSGVFSIILKFMLPSLSVILLDFAYPQKDIELFVFIIALGVVLYFTDYYFLWIYDFFQESFKLLISQNLAEKVYLKVLKLTDQEQKENKIDSLNFEIINGSNGASDAIVKSCYTVPIEFFKLFLFFSIYSFFDPVIAIIAAASIPLYLFERRFFSERIATATSNRNRSIVKLFEHLEEKLMNLRTIKVFLKEKEEWQSFRDLYSSRVSMENKLQNQSNISNFVNSSLLYLWKVSVMGFLGYKVISGKITVGQMMALTAYIPMIEVPIRKLSTIYPEYVFGMNNLKGLDKILQLEEESNSCKVISFNKKQNSLDQCNPLDDTIRLSNVRVDYNNSPRLQNLSFDIKPNSSIAIVGESGAGKSTVFNLLLRFCNPNDGVIEINGHNVNEYSISDLRSKIGMVFQEITLFNGTIRENLLYGNPDATEDEMIGAAKMAAVHDYVNQMKNGYDTIISNYGLHLPGGLRQRIAIARALIKKPKILILDEATSSLDAESEFLVRETIRRCRKKMTVIVVAHRLSTIKSFDQILVLAKGSIIERGNFKELMQIKGEFFKLYNLQFGGFEEFKLKLDIEFQRQVRYQNELSILLIEISEFDDIKNRYGQEIAAKVLNEIELIIKKKVRIMDFVSIYRLNKIVVGLPETPIEGARILGSRIREIVSKTDFAIDNINLKTTVAFGSASLRESKAGDPEELFEKAGLDLAVITGNVEFL